MDGDNLNVEPSGAESSEGGGSGEARPSQGRVKGSFRKTGRITFSRPEAISNGAAADQEAILKAKLEECSADNERLRKKNKDLANDLVKARSKLEAATRELEKPSDKRRCYVNQAAASEDSALKAELDGLRRINADLKLEAEGLRKELEAAKSRISELENAREPAAPPANEEMTVYRISETEFRSVLFDCPRYDVRLSRDGRRISFKPDVEGRVRCSRGVMSIPSLPDLIGFDGAKEYLAVLEGGRILVSLRRTSFSDNLDVLVEGVVSNGLEVPGQPDLF